MGNVQWSTNPGGIGPGDEPKFVSQTLDGGFLLPSDFYGGTGAIRISVLKTDSLGHMYSCADLPIAVTDSFSVCSPVPITVSTQPLNLFTTPLILDVYDGGQLNIICEPLSVNELSTPINSTTYPNPFTSNLTVTHPSAKGSIFITDITGKEVYRTAFTNSTGQQLQLAWLQPGMYFLTVSTNGVASTKKIIKL